MSKQLTFTYIKSRKSFGRQPLFCMAGPYLLDSISCDESLQKQFILRNPVHHEVQATISKSEHYANTKVIKYQELGINHAEGGWAKDINFNDEDMTSRYRRRIERDDDYVSAVLGVYPRVKQYIDQNNAIDLYTMYFKRMPYQEPVEKPSLRTMNVCYDDENRPVSCISWTQEEDSKIVVAYCDRQYFLHPRPYSSYFLMWSVDNSVTPYMKLEPPVPCWQVCCSPVHPAIIVGGLRDGRVCIFDIRASIAPVAISQIHLAHLAPISSLVYIPSRFNNEFFSGSSDGQCMWWDNRDLTHPTESLIMNPLLNPGEPSCLSYSESISALQFDRAFPTKFLCGTDTGLVVNVNRKGKSHNEKMASVFHAHNSPVMAVHRSPCTSKMFLTCGDYSVKIWSDEVLSSPIVSGTSYNQTMNDVVWCPQRYSSYMAVCGDGKFRFWDMLRRYKEPVLTFPISKYSLLKLKPNEEGSLVAIGDSKGMLTILSLSENLVTSSDHDKHYMMQMYERETHRERILENRIKEIRLKLKAEDEAVAKEVFFDEEALLRTVEDEYRKTVEHVKKYAGMQSMSSDSEGKLPKMRTR